MLLFKKLVDESQMPQSQEYTFIITYKLFLVFTLNQIQMVDPVVKFI